VSSRHEQGSGERWRALAEGLDGPEGPLRWHDWRWQLRHAVTELTQLEDLLELSFAEGEREDLRRALARFPMRITPHYLSLVDREDPASCPIFVQAVPSARELCVLPFEGPDPLQEDVDSPAPGLTHRYPDRALFHVSGVCAVHCRHCTRKRRLSAAAPRLSREALTKGLEVIRGRPEIRDVLLSGGEPLLLPVATLSWLLGELGSIPHVEILRIGTRVPVVLPQRITPGLLSVLRRHRPLWLNTHFNHPRELSPAACEALGRLADAGIPLGNQSVLLAGVNDRPETLRSLCLALLRHRVRPYYLYQCDLTEGLSHFRTPLRRGPELLEALVGHHSGLAVPRFVVDTPAGKIPIAPGCEPKKEGGHVLLRGYDGRTVRYPDPEDG
jgi:lysine 2,3-aminomutase